MNQEKVKHNTYWSTRDETRFLRSIGRNSCLNKPREEMLIKYRDTMKYRDRWDGIDKFYITLFIDSELSKIKASEDLKSTKKLDKVERTQGRRYIPKVLAS